MDKADDSYMKELAKIERQQLLVLDDFGIQPFDAQSRAALMEIIGDWEGNTTLIITWQLPVRQWFAVIGEKTVLMRSLTGRSIFMIVNYCKMKKLFYKKRVSPSKAIQVLKANDIIVSEAEAQKILDFMYTIGEIAIEIYDQEDEASIVILNDRHSI